MPPRAGRHSPWRWIPFPFYVVDNPESSDPGQVKARYQLLPACWLCGRNLYQGVSGWTTLQPQTTFAIAGGNRELITLRLNEGGVFDTDADLTFQGRDGDLFSTLLVDWTDSETSFALSISAPD